MGAGRDGWTDTQVNLTHSDLSFGAVTEGRDGDGSKSPALQRRNQIPSPLRVPESCSRSSSCLGEASQRVWLEMLAGSTRQQRPTAMHA